MATASFNVAEGRIIRSRPKFKKSYIAIILAIAIVVALGLAYFLGAFKDKKGLIPPNPNKRLPASASILKGFDKQAVIADNAECAKVGSEILNKNGTAVDAAIATLFCNGVATMQSMGIGGGFLMTIYSKKDRQVFVLNAREKAPLDAKASLYSKDNPQTSKHGPLSIGVPGELRGYKLAHDRFGKLPWADLVQPAINLCENGFQMSKHQQLSLKMNDVSKDPNLIEWFADADGKYKKPGSQISPTKLCETLRDIQTKGAEDFYTGGIAKKLLRDIREMGGIIRQEDLENYTADWMAPVAIRLNNGDSIYSVPPPGSGSLVSFALKILDGYNFTRADIKDEKSIIRTYHRIIEAFKYTYAKRTELGDINFVNITELLQNLTSPVYANDIRMKIKDDTTFRDPKHYGGVYYAKSDHGTSHISVLSKDGDAVSVTSSVNIYFGSGYTSEQTGIILNSVMDDFSFPGFKNYFNLPGSPNNEMRPGKRPLSSMSPTIVLDSQGDVKLVVGASGGTKITSSVALTILRTLLFGQNIKEAVDAPRIHHQLYPMLVSYEFGLLHKEVEGLEKLGHTLKREKPSSCLYALFKNDGKIYGAPDERKGGDVFGL